MNLEKVNQLLEDFYKLFYETEELAVKHGFKGLTTTELHIIEAIGNESLTMNKLSDKLGITMGTATVAINKLSEKEFIERKRCDHDRRKVFVSLSKRGLDALEYHHNFHKKIIAKITGDLTNKDLEVFTKTFGKILNNLKYQLHFIRPDLLSTYSQDSILNIIEIKGTPAAISFFKDRGIVEKTTVKIISKTSQKLLLRLNDSDVELSLADAKNIIANKLEK